MDNRDSELSTIAIETLTAQPDLPQGVGVHRQRSSGKSFGPSCAQRSCLVFSTTHQLHCIKYKKTLSLCCQPTNSLEIRPVFLFIVFNGVRHVFDSSCGYSFAFKRHATTLFL
jgi:hypothetical protein